MEDYLDGLDSGLDDHEKSILLLLSKTRLWEKDPTLTDYILASDIVQSHLVGLNLRKEKLVIALLRYLKKWIKVVIP